MDHSVAQWFHDLAQGSPWLARTAQIGDVALSPTVFRILLVLVVFWVWRTRAVPGRVGALGLGAMAFAGVLSPVLKALIQRPRPVWADPVATETGWSMPSGHALNAAAGCGLALVLLWPSLGRRGRFAATGAGVALTLAAMLDRLVLGVHYLSDVIVGALLGVAVAVVVAMAVDRMGPGHRPGP